MKILSDEFGRRIDEYIVGAGMTIGAGLMAFLVGGCTVGVAEMVSRSDVKDVEKHKIDIPACTEADLARITLDKFPINVSNEDIGRYICYVRVAEPGRQGEENPDDRIELRFRN
jgi:hypothetical protein